jgi:hypothetical protein
MFSRILAVTLGIFGLSISLNTSAAIVTFVVPLDGHQEISVLTGLPDGGDPDGTGTATLMIDNIANSISWEITVANILLPPIGAHIHQQVVGVNGGIVVNFSGQLSGANLVDVDLANVLANPAGFYVNIHNEAFPSGAIRGQLGSPVPAPAGVLLLATGIAAVGGRRLLRAKAAGMPAAQTA